MLLITYYFTVLLSYVFRSSLSTDLHDDKSVKLKFMIKQAKPIANLTRLEIDTIKAVVFTIYLINTVIIITLGFSTFLTQN